ncbi:nose resistant to fluoxetine protein 6-like [Plodia interpunctella]|uniref:nose resistant to fluoxetine protein 6-like n=1 Tax=Plodia interpunctella TaxID=58824 RepID=UPI0023688530|nr:nose resistant to fluoxetine protein 6-like [Plodia interpunctella]
MINLLYLLLILVYKCSGFDVDDVQYDKMPPLFSLDDYNRCHLYNGTYCMVKVDLFADPSNDLMSLLKNYTLSSHIMHYNHTYLDKGICVHKTCRNFIGSRDLDTQADLHQVLQTCQNYTIFDEYGLEARVAEVYYCDKPNDREKEKITAGDWYVLTVCLLIVLVNVSATIYDFQLDTNTKARNTLNKGEELLLCFSMRRNWNYLIKENKKFPNAPNFDGISFFRVSASFMMVLGHVNWIYTMGFIDNTHDFERSYTQPQWQVIFNGMIVVQIFFVISGFLMMTSLNLDSEVPGWLVMARTFKNRFIRLAPSLAVMLAFTATWMRFLGSGPLWNKHATPVVNDCGTWWWTHLLFINNYVQENKYCAIQTWHIAADTQLFMTCLAVFLLTKHYNRLNVMYAMLLISFVPPALHVYFQDMDAMLLKNPEFLRTLEDKNFGGSYVLGHNSLSCFVLGTIVAYKLREWLKNGVVFEGTLYRCLFRLSVPVIMLCFNAGSFFYEEDHRTPLWIRMLFNSTHKFIFGLLTAFMIVGFAMKFDRVSQRFMQWHGFVILGKLTYSVYIVHMNFVPIIAGTRVGLAHFSYLNMMLYQFGVVAISYMISLPLFLMVEAPATPFINLLFSPAKAPVVKNKTNLEQDKDEGKQKLPEESIRESNGIKKSE